VETFVDESFRKSQTTLSFQRLHEFTSNKHRGVESSAIGFNAACDIHGVPDQGELKPFFAANISLYYLAVMNANGDADGTLIATGVPLVPAFDRFHDFQSTPSRVCGIPWARQGWAKKRHQPVAQIFVYRSVIGEDRLA
jgi:hypothetical protein